MLEVARGEVDVAETDLDQAGRAIIILRGRRVILDSELAAL